MILVNGNLQDNIAATDRGLAYGDGLFETMAMIEGKILLWQQHMQRLERGCKTLQIPFPGSDVLQSDIDQLESNGKSVVKIMITRGDSGRGYGYKPGMEPSRIVMQSAWPIYANNPATRGVKVHVCKLRLSSQPLLAGIKHLSRLEQVMARAEWNDQEIAEGLILDQSNHLIEGTMSNVFLFADNDLYTPVLERCGVMGVQRDHVISLARQSGIKVYEQDIPISQIKNFSEVFLTNSLIGIWPVISIGAQTFEIGSATRNLQHLLQHPV